MFSREDVANYLNQNFEASWEMVRPVPIVRIDFGNGNVATRTLHGNIASYVCGADGQVVDILPGIYVPASYLAALEQPRTLAGELSRLEPALRINRLQEYHRQRARTIRIPVAAQPARLDPGKRAIEIPLERIVIPAPRSDGNAGAGRPRTAAELANWQPLVADTLRNETERRLLIHQRFAGAEPVRPEQIKRWLYRDVLHADLDDPYLGLGDDLFVDLEH